MTTTQECAAIAAQLMSAIMANPNYQNLGMRKDGDGKYTFSAYDSASNETVFIADLLDHALDLVFEAAEIRAEILSEASLTK